MLQLLPSIYAAKIAAGDRLNVVHVPRPRCIPAALAVKPSTRILLRMYDLTPRFTPT
jgi:hypothetical protein